MRHRNTWRALLAVVTIAILASCANTPDVTRTYYLPQAELTANVTQSLACDNNFKSLIRVTTVTFQPPKYTRNRGVTGTFAYKALSGVFRDSNVGLTTTSDGRLSGVNASGTGAGTVMLQSLINVGSSIAGVVAHTADGKPGNNDAAPSPPPPALLPGTTLITSICGNIQKLNDASAVVHPVSTKADAATPGSEASAPRANTPVVTLTYSTTIVFNANGTTVPAVAKSSEGTPDAVTNKCSKVKDAQDMASAAAKQSSLSTWRVPVSGASSPVDRELDIDANNAFLLDALTANDAADDCSKAWNALAIREFITPVLDVDVQGKSDQAVAQVAQPASGWGSGFLPLKVSQMYNATVTVERNNAIGLDDKGQPEQTKPYMLAQTTLDVPTDSKDDTLTVPIPEAYLFGQTMFALAIADSGMITQLQYGSTSGASDVTNAVSSIATKLTPKTAEQKAEAVQGQADLIYQNERLAICEANPASCSSK